MIRCALSAHILPLITVLSHSVNEFSFWAMRSARMRSTFCFGVSGRGGALGILGFGIGGCRRCEGIDVAEADEEGLLGEAEKVLAERRIWEGLL